MFRHRIGWGGLVCLFAAGLGAPVLCAEERASGDYTRKALLEHFRYQGEQGTEATEVKRDVSPSSENEAGVVTLPTFEVDAPAMHRGLEAAIANSRSPLPLTRVKFGTGVWGKDFGKVRGQVVTILYIPIFVGLSW